MENNNNNKSTFVSHEPCPACASSDANSLFSDGHMWCFACDHYTPGDGEASEVRPAPRRADSALLEGDYVELRSRKLTEQTCRKWAYMVSSDKSGNPVQIANYKDMGGRTVCQKLRTTDKDFPQLGDTRHNGLYGMHLSNSGQLVVTEGELDAMSVYQVTSGNCNVVSVKNGAKGAKKNLLANLEYLQCFTDGLVLMFDMDDQGEAAALECAEALYPMPVRLAVLPMNDANACLVGDRAGDIIKAVAEAELYVSPNAPKKILSMIGGIELKDPVYLIDGIIEEQSLVGLIGPSGSGKTFVVLDMAMSMALGKDYHGRDVAKGLVIMSAGEGHRGIPRRAEAWCKYHLKDLNEASLAITSRAVDLFSPDHLSSFCREIDAIVEAHGNPKMIIIDTVARHMGGKDENNATDMGALIRSADKLKDDYGCAVVLVHHTGHASENRARGSTSYKGALDTEILVKPDEDHGVFVSCEKQKDGPPFGLMLFNKTPIEPSMVLTIDAIPF